MKLLSRVIKIFWRRPTIEPQLVWGDCGYVCISTVMALLGRPMQVYQIKSQAGTTARGLSLKQLRDGLRACGVDADVVFFDRTRTDSFPDLGILLLANGHYVVLSRQKGDRLEIFDPELGWSWTSRRKLARRCGGLSVAVNGLSTPLAKQEGSKPRAQGRLPFSRLLSGASGLIALGIFALAQLTTLALPLVSMWSVDKSIGGLSLSLLGAIGIGFVALSLSNVLISLVGELLQTKAKRVAATAVSRVAFNSLAEKPAQWFETNTPSSVQNRMSSLDALMNFYIEVIRSAGALAVSFVVGLVALIFISPVLIIPSFCALLVSVSLDLIFDRSQRTHFASAVETMQRRQFFVLETLPRLPLIARFGGLSSARVHYTSMVRSSAIVEARMQSLRGWRAAIGGLAKSGETLFFVTLAAYFMHSGNFTVGGFVALGAYKELLATAIGSLFQLHLRQRTMDVHRLQASELLTAGESVRPASRVIERGEVRLTGVSFAYGSLERPVLTGVTLTAAPGECVIIRGPSGAGKSTIAKLLVGQLAPTGGEVAIDGLPPVGALHGMAAVLQSDGLIGGSIRDNLLMYRRKVDDAELMAALEVAALDRFVRGLPMRLSTQVGDGIGGLSGGQRQRLLIARAVLGKPRLLILDEATSSL
ncbi:MAG TPA: ATP-binding cassette domain-containing protein, partial [Pirellulales bacterium]|nr:ATP-binding cassette domain-containing protein [Pirellulales bacterium]